MEYCTIFTSNMRRPREGGEPGFLFRIPVFAGMTKRGRASAPDKVILENMISDVR